MTDSEEEITECCKTCRFYKKVRGEIYDICRYNPPVIFEVSQNEYGDRNYRSRYPEVSTTWWCGKYEYNSDLDEVKKDD